MDPPIINLWTESLRINEFVIALINMSNDLDIVSTLEASPSFDPSGGGCPRYSVIEPMIVCELAGTIMRKYLLSFENTTAFLVANILN